MRSRRLLIPISLALAVAFLAPLALIAQSGQEAGPILSGGRRFPLREPRFVPAAQANFLKNEDQVLGVSANGVAKAYRTQVIAFHHIIDDKLGQLPIMVTW